MNKQMGLLVMRDENDILEEYLNRIIEFYDIIYVLDGSDGEEGRHICSKFDEVVFYGRDNEMVKGPHNDSIRKYIWDIARKEVKDKKWVEILHPDEYCLALESEDVFFDTLRYPEHFAEKYPEQYEKCWYNSPEAYVDRLDD